MVLKVVISLCPVIFFLIGLILLDSFKLVKTNLIIKALLYGILAGIISYFIARILLRFSIMENLNYSNFISPLIEEIVKGAFFYIIIRSSKIGFMVDATIYGFAIGSGFAFIENIYYLGIIETSNPLIWVLRGLGTAVMHGGTTAIFAIFLKYYQSKKEETTFWFTLPAILLPVIIHSFYNHFLISPIVLTILQLVILPVLVILVYNRSEHSLRDWMELSLESDINIVQDINGGQFSQTKLGKYLYSLKGKFQDYVVVDMFCFLVIYAELSMRAKGVLMIREAGLDVPKYDDISEKFDELDHLEKNIGTTGKLALSPILKISTRDLWQLYFLKGKR